YAIDLLGMDWNQDGYPDLAMQSFSDRIQVFLNQDGASFERILNLDVFPPGKLETIAAGDFNQDGFIDFAGIHLGQEGSQLLALYGDASNLYEDGEKNPLAGEASGNEQYVLDKMDIDRDGDVDLLFTQSPRDEMVFFENRLKP
ncbi:hypothetical protein GF373_12720, partial [bacterium]|nr:hypothetical protein [bacterium]